MLQEKEFIFVQTTRLSNAIDEIFGGKFGKAKNVLIEEFLDGEEMSFLLLAMEYLSKALEQLKITKEFWKEIKEKYWWHGGLFSI